MIANLSGLTFWFALIRGIRVWFLPVFYPCSFVSVRGYKLFEMNRPGLIKFPLPEAAFIFKGIVL